MFKWRQKQFNKKDRNCRESKIGSKHKTITKTQKLNKKRNEK